MAAAARQRRPGGPVRPRRRSYFCSPVVGEMADSATDCRWQHTVADEEWRVAQWRPHGLTLRRPGVGASTRLVAGGWCGPR